MRIISGADAWKNIHRNFLAADHVATPFTLSTDDKFFFFGSCLARQMERAFRIRGLTALSTPIAEPPNEMVVGSENVNRFMPGTMMQEIAWATGAATFPTDSLISADGVLWDDLQLLSGIRPVSRDRALARRTELHRYFARIADANVVIVDLCMVDTWFDRQYNLVLNAIPNRQVLRREPDRFEFRMYDTADLRAELLELRSIIRATCRDARIILFVNPMPLSATFRPQDVTTVECEFRSVMRTAAGELAHELDDVAYYPLFEAMTTVPRDQVFDADNFHVAPHVLDAAMAAMLRSFGIDRVPTEHDFNEADYLAANLDVAAAVRDNRIASGYHHWLGHGRTAGRSLVTFGTEINDPIASTDMRVSILADVPERVEAGSSISIDIVVRNTGDAVYATGGMYPVYLCYRWYDIDDQHAEVGKSVHTTIPKPLNPLESATIAAHVDMPKQPGTYTLALTLLQQNVAWFDDIDTRNGSRTVVHVESERTDSDYASGAFSAASM